MKISKLPLEGLLLIELDLFKDERGFFSESFNEKKFLQLGLNANFVQDNHSYSYPNVLRGLHAQRRKPQGKLVGALRGRIFDVAVDLRTESKTFGQYYATELSAENGKLLWIPGGFLHGFCVLGNEAADVLYKVDNYYDPADEIGVNWSDKELSIAWPLSLPTVSTKDKELPSFKNALKLL